MNAEVDALVERLNAGAPIPEADPNDLHAALLFLAEARGVMARDDPGRAQQRGVGFFLDDLATRCSRGADVFAVAVRGALLDVVLTLPRARPEQSGPGRDELITQAIAKMPLVAADLKDPDAILRRIDEIIGDA